MRNTLYQSVASPRSTRPSLVQRSRVSAWSRDLARGALWAIVRYRWAESATSAWHTVAVIPSDATCLTVHGLRPSSTYLFTVLARTVSRSSSQPSAGLYSNVVNASTGGLSVRLISCQLHVTVTIRSSSEVCIVIDYVRLSLCSYFFRAVSQNMMSPNFVHKTNLSRCDDFL